MATLWFVRHSIRIELHFNHFHSGSCGRGCVKTIQRPLILGQRLINEQSTCLIGYKNPTSSSKTKKCREEFPLEDSDYEFSHTLGRTRTLAHTGSDCPELVCGCSFCCDLTLSVRLDANYYKSPSSWLWPLMKLLSGVATIQRITTAKSSMPCARS